LFATARKRALPLFPACVGIITSPQAAALRDVLTTLKQRMPGVPVVLYPAPVQGTGSAEKIAQAILLANQRAECDVLIVCRGGGSIEDLWAFNEEVVARAIAASKIPIVSGVGHETDFTITDFVADERAPTPTAAAQRVVPDRHALIATLWDRAQQLARAQRNRWQNITQTLDYLQRRVVHPAQQLQDQAQRLILSQQRMQRVFGHARQQQQWQWQSLLQRLRGAVRASQIQNAHQVENLAQKLLLLNPQHVLQRGYSLVQDAHGHVVSDPGKLQIGADLHITFAQGWGRAELKDKGRRVEE
jgi:exodeoxyribonuclease VII large subunit